MASVLLICGTGTEIGKTHFSTALLKRAGRDRQVLGYKPVESGCSEWGAGSDHQALAEASTFHVKHLPEYCLAEPVSPHLAARREGRVIEADRLRSRVQEIAEGPDWLLVELAGGLFSPLTDTMLNADFLRVLQSALPTTQTILVAPDRLGVLHDIAATTRAADHVAVHLDGIVLSAPREPDSATGANAGELPHVTTLPLFGNLPRLTVDALVAHAELDRIYSLLLRNFSLPASIK